VAEERRREGRERERKRKTKRKTKTKRRGTEQCPQTRESTRTALSPSPCQLRRRRRH
jgi:hypothetical protein